MVTPTSPLLLATTGAAAWSVAGSCAALLVASGVGLIFQEKRHRKLKAEYRRLRTDLTRANERAASSRGEKAHILRLTLEDLVAPLADLEAQLEAAQERPARETVKLLPELQEKAERMRRALGSLQELQTLDHRSGSITFAAINVGGILLEAVSAAKNLAQQNGVRLSLPAATKGALARADARIMRKVLSNLLSQAIAVSPAGSAVSLSFYSTEDRVLITVSDEGPGATVIDQANMLSDSGESRPPMAPETEGAALNLAMIHNLVGAMEGFFWSQSEPGRGTTHVIELPLTQASAMV